MAHPDMPTTERERLAGIHSRKADEIRDGLKQLGLIEEMELPNPKGGRPSKSLQLTSSGTNAVKHRIKTG